MNRVTIDIGGFKHSHENVISLEVDGVTVYTAPPPAPTIPFKVGDFVRVKKSVNRCGTEDGPKARTGGKVINVEADRCRVEFPGYIRGECNPHSRVYFLNRRDGRGPGYRPGKHEAISNIRLIKS